MVLSFHSDFELSRFLIAIWEEFPSKPIVGNMHQCATTKNENHVLLQKGLQTELSKRAAMGVSTFRCLHVMSKNGGNLFHPMLQSLKTNLCSDMLQHPGYPKFWETYKFGKTYKEVSQYSSSHHGVQYSNALILGDLRIPPC